MIKVTAPLLAEYYDVSTRTIKRKASKFGGLKSVKGIIQTIIELEEKKESKKSSPPPPL